MRAEHRQVTNQKWWCVSFPRSGKQLSLPKQERKHTVFSSWRLNPKWQLPLQHYHAERLYTENGATLLLWQISCIHAHSHGIITSPLKPSLLDKCYLYVSYWGVVCMHKNAYFNQKVPKELCSCSGRVPLSLHCLQWDNALELRAHTQNQKRQSTVLHLIPVLYLICTDQLKA